MLLRSYSYRSNQTFEYEFSYEKIEADTIKLCLFHLYQNVHIISKLTHYKVLNIDIYIKRIQA